MKKTHLFVLFLTFFIFSFSNLSYGWQGRMGGMGDPYGLVQDESDFLFHPARIANGKGINFYGGYRFNYTNVGDWNINLTYLNLGFTQFPFKSSGDEWRHEGLLGATFPLGPGNMGVFFEYQGRRGEYDGDVNPFGTFSLKDPLDAFSLRGLYGQPINGMDVGFELGIDYKDEKNKTSFLGTGLSPYTENYVWGLAVPERALRLFMIPYDSNYWDFSGKLGIGKKSHCFDIDATLKGSYIFSSKNRYQYIYQDPLGSNDYDASMDGKVKGYYIGSDIWVRGKLEEGMALPFLLSINYGVKNWGGDGIGTGGFDSGASYDYGHKEKEFVFKMGGGLEKKFADNTLVAGGLYYNYIKNKESIWVNRPSDGSMVDDGSFPSLKEHRLMLRLSGEKNLSPLLALRMGLNLSYSWVKEKYDHYFFGPTDFSLDGHRWGIGASLGGTVKFQRFNVEPFLTGGYQKLSLNGDGSADSTLIDASKTRKEWSVGGGLSIKFN